MLTLADITARDWSMQLDSSTGSSLPGAGLGTVVESFEDIAQCIGIILRTPKGTDPLRPDFATDIFAFLDRPVTLVIPHLVREVFAALTTYEPRIVVVSVSVTLVPSEQGGAHLQATVKWRLNVQPTSAVQTTVVILGGAER